MTEAQIKSWRTRVEAADSRGVFTGQDREDAASWGTCAVGEQRKNFPAIVITKFKWLSTPIDPELYALGNSFDEAVDCNDILYAYEVLDLIEARVMELA